MSSAHHFDVIIIGTGAGGGTLAYALALSGKRILLLERGDYVAREKDNWSPRAVNVDGKYQTREVWRDADGKPLHPHTSYNVGGNTKFYGAALFRLRREDFGEVRHHGGTIALRNRTRAPDSGSTRRSSTRGASISTAPAAVLMLRRPACPLRTTSRRPASSTSPTNAST